MRASKLSGASEAGMVKLNWLVKLKVRSVIFCWSYTKCMVSHLKSVTLVQNREDLE